MSSHQREFHYRWEWDLQSDPESLWPFVSDTNRFNRDTGLPTLERRPRDGVHLPNARRRLSFTRMGMPVEWEEEPFEWVRPYRYGVVRRYRKGPIAEMRTLAELTLKAEGGTRLVYQVWARPKNSLGLVAIPMQIGVISARSFEAAFRRYDQLATHQKTMLDMPATVHFVPGGRERMASIRDELLAGGADAALLARLVGLIERAGDLEVARMRPYALADLWDAPRRTVLELFLRATRAGLLDFQWELLCPLCRGPQDNPTSLGAVHSQVHCDSCNIDFNVNFDRSVELTFRPNAAVRRLDVGDFCVGGPQVTPHIVVQQLLPAGMERSVTPMLGPGRYRLRTLELPGGQYLHVTPGGTPEATLRVTSSSWPDDEPEIAPVATLWLVNATDSEQLFILERLRWSDQAATAADVTALQLFRDLFANEALRPGERIAVGSLVVLFTDLRGSTQLYREIGDAPAFGRVMDHFAVLRSAVAAEDGAVVKTIGDAIMAVFRRPVGALRAIVAAQQQLGNPADGSMPLFLKAGIHAGPSIAVTLNDRLDYFGSTINIGARLEGLSSGDDVIVSDTVRADPEVAQLLARPESGLVAESFTAVLKGFEQQHFELWRVRRTRPDAGREREDVVRMGSTRLEGN